MGDIGSFGFRDPFDRHAAIEGPQDYDRRERGHRAKAGNERRRPHRDDLGHDYRDRELVPNDMFSSMFSGMRSMMNQMERNFVSCTHLLKMKLTVYSGSRSEI